MQAKNKRKLMLSVLAFLLLVRFVVVPIVDWQQQQIEAIAAQSNKLAKVNRLTKHLPQLNSALLALQQTNRLLQERYTHQSSLQRFKLQQQQQIESLFKSHNIKIKNFNWVAEIPGEISEVRAKISFSGKSKDLAMLHLAIARQPKLLDIAEWTLRINRMKDNSLGSASGNLLLLAYHIPAMPESAL